MDPMLDELQGQLRRVWADAAGIGVRPDGADRIAHGFAQAGHRLVRRTDDPLEIALAGLLRRFGDIDLPWTPAPRLTALIKARADVAATMKIVRNLAPCPACELIVLDDIGDPRTALLRAVLPNLVVVRTSTPADAVQRGAAVARGRCLVLLDGSVQSPSAAALAALARHSDAVVIGPSVMDRAVRTGIAGRLAAEKMGAVGRLGLVACVGAHFRPGLGSGDVDNVLAFSLRAREEGVPIMFNAEPLGGALAWTH